MTPHKASNDRGTLLFDRRFPGVGRLRTASGTKEPALFRKLNRMLTNLYEANPPRIDVLLAIQAGRIRPIEVYEMQQGGDLSVIPSGNGLEHLEALWGAWVDATANVATRRMRRQALGLLRPFTRARVPLVAHLPEAMRGYRRTCETAGTPAAFNRVRAAAMAFLRDELGTTSTLYAEVKGTAKLTEVRHKRPAPPILEAIRFRDELPAPLAAMWWAMARTGMGPKEYGGAWEQDARVVRIGGTKRKARVRVVPLLGGTAIPSPPMHRKTFELKLAAFCRASQGRWALTGYDARRAYGWLAEKAGLVQTERKQLMGHSIKADVTDGYSAAAPGGWLEAAGHAMQALIDEAEAALREERRAALKVG